ILCLAGRDGLRAAIRFLRRTDLARRATVFSAAGLRFARRGAEARSTLAVFLLSLAIVSTLSAIASATLAGASATAWASTLVSSVIQHSSDFAAVQHKRCSAPFQVDILCAASTRRLTATARPKQERPWTTLLFAAGAAC